MINRSEIIIKKKKIIAFVFCLFSLFICIFAYEL